MGSIGCPEYLPLEFVLLLLLLDVDDSGFPVSRTFSRPLNYGGTSCSWSLSMERMEHLGLEGLRWMMVAVGLNGDCNPEKGKRLNRPSS